MLFRIKAMSDREFVFLPRRNVFSCGISRREVGCLATKVGLLATKVGRRPTFWRPCRSRRRIIGLFFCPSRILH